MPQTGESYTQDYSDQSGCGGAVIPPHQAIDLEIEVSLLFPSFPGNVSITLVPGLTARTAANTGAIALPQMAGTEKFVDPHLFSCYGWNGKTFIPEKPDGSNVTILNPALRGNFYKACEPVRE